MKLKIQHPRILVVLLLIIAAAASAAILLANEDKEDEFPTKSLPIPAVPIATPIPLSEKDKDEAVNIVKESGVVEGINGGQDWETTRIVRTSLAGSEGIALHVRWSEPVESSGPWPLIRCSGTLKMFSTARWSQVTELRVTVDMKARSVEGLGVIGERDDIPQPILESPSIGETVKLYDVETGNIVYDGPSSDVPSLKEICAEGTYYHD